MCFNSHYFPAVPFLLLKYWALHIIMRHGTASVLSDGGDGGGGSSSGKIAQSKQMHPPTFLNPYPVYNKIESVLIFFLKLFMAVTVEDYAPY